MADAGPDQTVDLGDLVTLDGSGSTGGSGGAVNVALASNGATITGTNGTGWGQLIDGNSTNYSGSTGYGYTLWSSAPPGTMTVTLAETALVSQIRLKLWDLVAPCWRAAWVRSRERVLVAAVPARFCQLPLWVLWWTLPERSETTLLGRFAGAGRAPVALGWVASRARLFWVR